MTVILVAHSWLKRSAEYFIMSITKNKGCGVALLNKLRHFPCLGIIFVIFCNNSCQVLLWQFARWHTSSSYNMPIKKLTRADWHNALGCVSLDVTNDTHIIMSYYHSPTCTMNMCHKPVHDLVRICTYDHAHHISNTYAHDPHHAHLVEIKHNAYMRALHSRDAYDYGCIARLDRNHRRSSAYDIS